MAEIYVQFDAGRRLLACGFFPPRCLIGLKPGQAGSVFTALVRDAPAHLTALQVADLFLATRIDPPCFQVSFADLGPGWTIAGRALTLTEAAASTGQPRTILQAAVKRGDLPTFRPGKGSHLVNSLDLARYIADSGRPHGRPPKPAAPPSPPKKRPRAPKKKPG